MQRQHTATLHPSRQDRRPWLIAACGAALLAAVAVGIWQTVDRREGTTTTAVEQGTAAPAPTSATRPAVAAGGDALTVYVVGSAEEAARLTDALRAGNQVLGSMGRAPFAAQVVVAATPEDADFTAWTTAQADAIRPSEGLPPISLIDLRAR